MNLNWMCNRLIANTTTNCLTMLKVFAMLLVLCTLVADGRDSATKTISSNKIDLHEDNWQLMLQGEWMVEFFAPWCPACKNLAPTWESFAAAASELHVKVAVIDVTTSPSLSGRFFVTALPTIYHVLNGEFRHYRGSRDADSLYNFLKKKQWTNIEPISSWKKPDTVHMSILSYFFKLSHALKDLNIHLQDEYNLPTWASYTLFAFATIFVGAALGLLLVFLVDSFYPPKKMPRQSFVEVKERDARDGVEDLDGDELEDENEFNQNETSEEANGEETTNDDDDDEEADEENVNEENIKTEEKQNKKSKGPTAEKTEKENSKTNKTKATANAGAETSHVAKQTPKEWNSQDDKSSTTNVAGADMRKRNKPRKAD